MKNWQNESFTDRIIRAVIGIILLALAYYILSGVLVMVAYVIAVIAIFTSLTGFCALYKLFGFSTIKKDNQQKL
jgi:hypothetical protein